jgi:hypothetical protein
MSLASRPLRRALMLAACALLAAVGVAAPAQASTINEKVPIEFDNTNPCTGEHFHYATTWHIVGDEDGGKIHLNSQQTDGIGEFGNKYIVNQSENLVTHDLSNGASPETLRATFNIIDAGAGDNFILESTFHVTTNANGDLTAYQDSGHATCVG